MKARIIQVVEGHFIPTEVAIEDIIPAMEVRGAQMTGFCNRRGIREELRGLPVFSGFAGPMWDGDAIRYESSEAYNMLSV
jgi:hypothetical protein